MNDLIHLNNILSARLAYQFELEKIMFLENDVLLNELKELEQLVNHIKASYVNIPLPFSSVQARGLMQEYVIIAKRVTDNKDLTISDFQSVLEEALLIEKDKRPTVTTKLNRMKTAELLAWDIGETKSVSIGLGKKAEEHAKAIYNRFLSQADVKELDKIIVKLQLQKIS